MISNSKTYFIMGISSDFRKDLSEAMAAARAMLRLVLERMAIEQVRQKLASVAKNVDMWASEPTATVFAV